LTEESERLTGSTGLTQDSVGFVGLTEELGRANKVNRVKRVSLANMVYRVKRVIRDNAVKKVKSMKDS